MPQPVLARALGAAVVLLTMGFQSSVASDDYYRWVDPHGEVQYTDAPPPESAQNDDSKDAGDEGTQQDPGDAQKRRRDRVLLDSYTEVEEIKEARERHLEGIGGRIGLAEHRVRQALRQIERYDNLLDELPEDNANRAEMQRQRAQAVERLERRRQQLKKLKKKRERIRERFARDIERFRELMADSGKE